MDHALIYVDYLHAIAVVIATISTSHLVWIWDTTIILPGKFVRLRMLAPTLGASSVPL